MLKKTILATTLAALISGCSVSPQVIPPEEVLNTVRSDLSRLSLEEEKVDAPITLHEAIARAVKYNRDKKLQALESALAQGQIELVQHEMLPSLTANAGYTKRNNFAASASVTFVNGEPSPLGSNPSYSVSQDKERSNGNIAFSWNVLDFGLSYVRANQQADRYLIAKERERKVAHNITQDVRAAYWRAVSAERLLRKITPLIGDASKALGNSRKVEQRRLRSPLEALYYQREVLDVLGSLQSLRRDLVHAKTELAALMGMKPGTVFDLAGVDQPVFAVPEVSIPVQEMEERALSQRPELVETYYQKRISAADTRAAMLGMLPGVTLQAGAYRDNSDFLLNQDWTSVGARISWNLFDVFKVGTEQDLAKTREALAEEQRLAASMAVLTQVHLANVRYVQARKSFELADQYHDVATRINDQARNSAKTQRGSELDVIRESLNALLAELRRDMAYAELQNSYGRIFVTMGMDLLPSGYKENSLESVSSAIEARFDQWKRGDLGVVETSGPDEDAQPEVSQGDTALQPLS